MSTTAQGKRVKRQIASGETWQVYGIGGELLAEYISSGAQLTKEYGYLGGQLLITAAVYDAERDKWGYIDKSGSAIIPVQFASATDFSDGLALIVVLDSRRSVSGWGNRSG